MRNHFVVLSAFLLVGIFARGQTTETFETESNDSTTFTDNSVQFTISGSQTYDIFDTGDGTGFGWNGTAADDRFIDNSGAAQDGTNTELTIKTTNGSEFLVFDFYLYAADFVATLVTNGTVTFTGKKNGGTEFTFSKTTGFNGNLGTNNGYTFINFATEGGTNRTGIAIDELVISGTGGVEYLGVDAFRWAVADATPPNITAISIPNAAMNIGDTVTATITVASDADTYSLGTSNIGGFTLGSLSKTNNTTYTATFTVTNGGTDVAAGSNIPLSVVLNDSAGNASTAFTTAISQAGDPIDANRPVVTAVSIPNAAMNVGDVVTATITVTSDTDTYSLGTSNIGGFTLGSLSKTNNTTYTATFTVTNGGTDVAAGSNIPLSVVLNDSAGNASTAFTTAISQAGDPIDANRPVVTAVSIPNAAMKVGSVVTATITVTSDTDTFTLGSSNIGGFTLGSLSKTNNTTYTATFTVTNGGTDVAAGSNIPLSVVLNDSAGNASTAFTTAISQAGDPIDANRPVISAVSIPNAAMKIGDTVTATITVTSDTDTFSLGSSNIGGFTLGSLSKTNNTTYTATFTVTNGGTDVAAGSNIPLSVVLNDSAGNASTAFTTAISQAGDPVDANRPVVTAVSIPNAAMKVGSVVTATITVTSDADTFSLGTSNIGGFTLGSLSKTNNTTYTATFTVTNGGTDVAAGSNIPLSVVLNDSAGNASTAFTTAISQAGDPIDANRPVISAVSIPNVPMNVGDTVTATITVTSDADTYTLGTSNIGGYTLGSLSKTNNTTYTATFTISGGSDVAAGSDISLSVVLNDSAGNASTAFTTAISQGSDPINAVNDAPVAGFGQALTFEASRSEGVQVSDNNAIDFGTGSFTVEAWIKRTGAANLWFTVAGKQQNGGGNPGWYLRFDDNRLSFFAGSNGVTSTETVTDTNWHHVVGVLDASAKTVTVYLDGAELESASFVTASDVSSTAALGIGYKPNFGEYFDGAIDDVRVWTAARTAPQITEFMRTPLAGTETDLVGYWNFEEGSGTSTANRTATSGLDGTLQNSDSDEWGAGNIGYSVTTAEDTNISLRLGGSDLDSQASATAVITALPSSGDLFQTNDGSALGTAISATGTALTDTGGNPRRLIYVPDANSNGSDSFTYKVNDGSTDSANTVTVSLTISAANDVPTLTTVSTLTGATEDTAFTITYADLAGAANESDVEGSTLSFRVEAVSTGTLTKGGSAVVAGTTLLATSEELVWTPASNANGTLNAFTIKAWDGTAASATAVQVQVTASGVNDAPTQSGLPASRTFTEDTQASFDIAASAFSDADSANVTVVIATSAGTFGLAAPGGITLSTLSGNGTSTITIAGTIGNVNQYLDTASNVSYTPASNANGAPAATVTVTGNDGDGSGDVSLGTIDINVTAVNDAPTFTAGATLSAVNEDTAAPSGATITSLLGANFSDVDTSNTFAGIAVVTDASNSGTQGNWEYSTDGGTAWFDIGSVSTAAGLLLDVSTRLRFVPVANFNGTPGALTVHAVDDSSATTFTSGSTRQTFDTTADDATSKVAAAGVSVSTSITAVNDTPVVATNTGLTLLEGGQELIASAQLNTTDVEQAAGSLTYTITTAPTRGTLIRNGTNLALNDTFTQLDINSSLIAYEHNGGETTSDSFGFSVSDGTASVTNQTFAFTITPVNEAPAGANKTITLNEDATHTFAAADFGFSDSDSPAQALNAVKITTLPGAGTLTNNGAGLSAGDFVSAADIAGNKLVFTPATNANGSGYAAFTFQVQDDGGTSNGGVDLDASANTITLDVTALNDAPAGTNKTITTAEDTAYTFAAADFGFSDPNDSPANTLNAVKITTLPGAGTLTDDGATISAGDFVTAAAIAGSKLVFTPGANGNGASYTSFTFQVQDNGGTANGGVDLDASANTITIDVTATAETPGVTNATTNEDTQTTSGLVISRNAGDGAEVTHFKITSITGGSLFQNDGTTAITNNAFITFAQGNAGLKFTPSLNLNTGAGDTFSFVVQAGTDNSGGGLSTAGATATITVNAVNDAPVVTASGGTTAYTEGNNTTATLAIDTGLTVTDADDTTLDSATVSITGGFQTAEDVLGFTNQNGISGSYNSGIGVLTLTGSASLANYQTALRSVTYANTSNTPNTSNRTITFIANDGSANSSGATKTVSVAAVNDTPVVAASGGTTAFTEGNNTTSTPVAIDTGLTVSDLDTANLAGATVSITSGFQTAEDALAFTDQNGISGSYDSGTGVLTLSGSASVANYQTALRSVTYTNSSNAPETSNRVVSFVVNDGNSNSAAGTQTVSIAATNDTPTDIALSAASVNQSAGANATVGTLSASDLDDTAFTFSLVSGTGDTHNSSFNLSGTTLRANDAAALPGGTYSVRVQADDGDTAGTYAEAFTITVVDNVAPAAPAAPDLDAASDSGSSSTDNRTTDPTPTFSGTAEAGSTVTLLENATVLGTTTATGGNWSITSSTLAAGAHTIKATAKDAANNTSADSGTITVTIDLTAPTLSPVAIASDNANTARAKVGDVVTVSFTSSETIATPTVTIAGSAASVTNVSGNDWTATYTMASGDTAGAVAFNIAFADLAGNAGTAVTATTDSSAVTFDKTAPTITPVAIASNNANPIWAKVGDVVTVSFTSSETIAAPTVTIAGHAASTSNTGNDWTATATMAAGDTEGAVAFNIAFADLSGNAGTAITATTDSSAVTFDKTAPTIAIGAPSATTTRTGPITYTVTYADTNFNASTLATGNITLNKTGTADATVGVSGTGLTRTVTLSTVTGNGTIGLSIAAGTATDQAGNTAAAAGPSATFTVDNALPIVASIRRQTPVTVNTDATTVTWRVTFDGGVTGVDLADFALTVGEGSPAATTASVTAVSTSVYDVAVDEISGQGMLRLDLKSSGTGIADLAGNAIANAGFTTGDFYIVGVTSVFDTAMLASDPATTQTVTSTNGVAQRFTTAAAAPLTLTTVTAALGAVNGTALEVRLFSDDAGDVGDPIATLDLVGTLTADALNVWTSDELLTANTTYWIVFTTSAGDYEVKATADGTNSGGQGDWLTGNYVHRHGAVGENLENGPLLLALGATSVPSVTSALTASGTYGTAFSYQITATNTPSSYSATGLPAGLSVNATSGLISGTPGATGSFNVTITATNGSGTSTPATLVIQLDPAFLSITANSVTRAFGAPNPSFTFTYNGFVGGDGPGALASLPTASTTATAASPVGTYPITLSGGSSTLYTIGLVNGTLTVGKAAQTIAITDPGDVIIGSSVTLAATASSGLPVTFSLISGPATLSGAMLATNGVGTVTVRASQAGNGNYNAATQESTFNVVVGPASVTTPEQIPTPPVGSTAQLVVVDPNPNVEYQWQRNGSDLPDASGPTLDIDDAQPPIAGLYTYTATVPGGGEGGTSDPVIVGISTTEKVVGTGEEVGTDILHPNGNTYDQVLLEGSGATVTANTNQVTRISFIDMQDDIVQVELSGAGTLSLVVDNASIPAPPASYNQPNIDYVKGHAGIVITGANETTNVTVFSVGRATAVNQALFNDAVDYDGTADVAFLAIQSTDGKFGGVRTGNVQYFATQGFTGVYAPGVELTGPLNVGNVSAFDSATPVLIVGSVATARIAGGDLFQSNGQPVQVSGITQLLFVDGTTSHGETLPAQQNRGVLIENGVDVTDDIVVNP